MSPRRPSPKPSARELHAAALPGIRQAAVIAAARRPVKPRPAPVVREPIKLGRVYTHDGVEFRPVARVSGGRYLLELADRPEHIVWKIGAPDLRQRFTLAKRTKRK